MTLDVATPDPPTAPTPPSPRPPAQDFLSSDDALGDTSVLLNMKDGGEGTDLWLDLEVKLYTIFTIFSVAKYVPVH